MLKVVTGMEMSNIDKYTINEIGIEALVLMERAAISVAVDIMNRSNIKEEKVVILCGLGNNGGDGLAIARLLFEDSIDVDVLIISKRCDFEKYNKVSVETKKQYKILKVIGVNVFFIDDMDYKNILYHANIIVDAIFGTGLTREIQGSIADVINIVNNLNKYVYAVDIPSGICSDTGQIFGTAIKADKTITFGLIKLGLLVYPGTEYSGEINVVDIGFPQVANNIIKTNRFIFEKSDIKDLNKRRTRTNKGNYGKILIIAGGNNMAGAAYLSAIATYRTGAGLVKILTHKDNRIIIQSLIPEAILSTYDTVDDNILENDMDIIKQSIKWANAIVVGPGMGINNITKVILELTLQMSECPIIIDADGLNILSKDMELLNQTINDIIVTPHVGEMARLVKSNKEYVIDNFLEIPVKLSQEYGVISVLKDARTIVTNSNGDMYLNVSGNPGMATAGSGDVLTGIIAGLIGIGIEPYRAACLGVYIHGLAGDIVKDKKGFNSLMASDIIKMISKVLINQ